jgi:hypothetical protein
VRGRGGRREPRELLPRQHRRLLSCGHRSPRWWWQWQWQWRQRRVREVARGLGHCPGPEPRRWVRLVWVRLGIWVVRLRIWIFRVGIWIWFWIWGRIWIWIWHWRGGRVVVHWDRSPVEADRPAHLRHVWRCWPRHCHLRHDACGLPGGRHGDVRGLRGVLEENKETRRKKEKSRETKGLGCMARGPSWGQDRDGHLGWLHSGIFGSAS